MINLRFLSGKERISKEVVIKSKSLQGGPPVGGLIAASSGLPWSSQLLEILGYDRFLDICRGESLHTNYFL
jgi:hypothetical protein